MGHICICKIPFGLMNVGDTFQRAIDYDLAYIKDIFIVTYLDDLVVFSKKEVSHVGHLRQVFERCRKFFISLNQKK
jgi:hypothetical protein